MTNDTRSDQRDPTPLSYRGGETGALLVHGFSGTPGEMRPLADYLVARGYAVEAPLLAGHGGTQEQLASVTWRDWVGSAETALTTLEARCRTVVLVGFSMGGAITLSLAARRRTAGIATLSALTRIKSPLTPLLPVARRFMPYVYPLRSVDVRRPEVLERLRDYMPDLDVDPSNPAQVAELRRGVKVSIGAVYELNTLLRQMRASLPRVTAPALIVQANHDEQIPLSSADEIYRRVGSGDKRIVRLDRGGHLILAGPDRPQACAEVGSFVEHIDDIIAHAKT